MELNGEPIGTINRTPNNFAMNNVTMTYLNDTEVSLKEGDMITITASEDGKFESGWVDAVVLKNISLDDPKPSEPRDPENPGEPEDPNEPENPDKPEEEPEDPEQPGDPEDPEQPGEDEEDSKSPGTSDETGNDKLPNTAT